MQNITINKIVGNGEVYSLSHAKLVASTLKLNATNIHPIPPTTTATAILDHCVIGEDSTITMLGTGGALELLKVNGWTINDGLIDVPFGTAGSGTRTGNTFAEIDIGKGGGGSTFENRGIISGHWTFNQRSALDIVAKTSGATFLNNGVINASTIKIDVNMLGNGKIVFATPTRTEMSQITTSQVEVDHTVGRGQVFDMTSDGSLTIGDVKDFHGTIRGFSGPHDSGLPGLPAIVQDKIDILGVNVTNATYKGTANDGTLTLKSGNKAVGNIHFDGDYRAAHFSVVDNVVTLAG